MSCENIEGKVRELIIKQLGVGSDEVFFPETDLVNDLDADSLDMVELMMLFEEEFEIDFIDSDEQDKVKTFKDAVDLVTRLTAAEKGKGRS